MIETVDMRAENTIEGVQYLMQYLVGISRLPLPKSTATQDRFVLLL